MCACMYARRSKSAHTRPHLMKIDFAPRAPSTLRFLYQCHEPYCRHQHQQQRHQIYFYAFTQCQLPSVEAVAVSVMALLIVAEEPITAAVAALFAMVATFFQSNFHAHRSSNKIPTDSLPIAAPITATMSLYISTWTRVLALHATCSY